MSGLTDIDKRYLERILGMGSGYVLDYSDATYEEFFSLHKIDIHGSRYQTYGTSKAKKMRAFWEVEPDSVVAPVLDEMLASYEADCELNRREVEKAMLDKSKAIVARLDGKRSDVKDTDTEGDFLSQEFKTTNLHKLPVEPQVATIVEQRLNEARSALKAGAFLSVVFLCGSVLEGVLLGAAQSNPEKFNRASASPKTTQGKVKLLHEWSLAQLIDVACEVGLLKLDVKKFSHGLRDFRNYIHPYEQLVSGFSPDQHTAKVCFHVLKAALASLAGER
ncbi:MAG: hypothetical protein JRG71_07890 [Deltaproteobacteria bacterium]|nr:hypothetical protein [Deltaproteobacteria bacterium]